MKIVLDKGPSEPKPLEEGADDASVVKYKADVAEHARWHEANPDPVEVRMHSVDANAAIAADPKRYSEVSRVVVTRKSGSLEDRVSNVEDRLDALENDEDEEVAEPKAKK